jgi:KAP family P-loop domain
MPEQSKRCPTHLLPDTPTREDAFRHKFIAKSIADLIETEKGGKSVGVAGTWGSGKSSVIEILRQDLSEKSARDVNVFVFDAWAHQGDPLRRTFLEQLIKHLQGCGWLSSGGRWTRTTDELSKRFQETETTTEPFLKPRGGIFAILLMLLPLGYSLISAHLAKGQHPRLAILGLFLLAGPFLLVAATWLLWRPGLKFWRTDFWMKNKTGHEKDSLLSLFMNKTIERQHSNTIRTPDPTSVEFQFKFSEVIGEALSELRRKLVLVMDNLDRVSPDDALEIWATMRTFFEFDMNSKQECVSRLWLIVPFDPNALERLWPSAPPPTDTGGLVISGTAEPALARSFSEKTFQTTFRVPPPVLSDWHGFLISQLKLAFPNHTDDDFHRIYRIYDLRVVTGSQPPTPRQIKLFVNSIGAIHRQWQDQIPLPIQALYVVFARQKADLELELTRIKDEDVLYNLPLDMVGPDWRQQLAAIHFNVEIGTALQVLMGTQVSDCLSKGEEGKLAHLASIPGFTNVLEKQVEISKNSWLKGESNRLTIAAAMLATLPESKGSSWRRIWEILCDTASQVNQWPSFDVRSARGIVEIARKDGRKEFIKHLLKSVTSSLPRPAEGGTVDRDRIGSWLDGSAYLLKELKADFGDAFDEEFRILGTPRVFIEVAVIAAKNKGLDDLREHMSPEAPPAQIIEELVKLAGEGSFADGYAAAVTEMVRLHADWPWDELSERGLSQRLRISTQLPLAEFKPLLTVLTELSLAYQGASEALRKVVTDGYMTHHLQASASDTDSTALCLFSILGVNPAGSGLPAPTPHSGTGLNKFNQLVRSPEEQVVVSLADLAIRTKQVSELFAALSTSQNPKAIIYAALKKIASDPEKAGSLSDAEVIDEREVLVAACDQEMYDGLVVRRAESAPFVSALITPEFRRDRVHLYFLSFPSNKRRKDFLDFLKKGLRELKREVWQEQLSSEGELVDLVLALIGADVEPNLEVDFEDALAGHARDILGGSAKVERFKDDWPKLVSALNSDLREAVIRRILDAICDADGTTEKLLQLYGSLLQAPQVLFPSREDLVFKASPKFFERSIPAELQWLMGVLEQTPTIYSEASPSARGEFTGRLRGAIRKGPTSQADSAPALARLAELMDIKVEPEKESEKLSETEGGKKD